MKDPPSPGSHPRMLKEKGKEKDGSCVFFPIRLLGGQDWN